MKIAKIDSKPETVLQEIERILDRNDATIFMGSGGLYMRVGIYVFCLRRIDADNEGVTNLPRALDSERLELIK